MLSSCVQNDQLRMFGEVGRGQKHVREVAKRHLMNYEVAQFLLANNGKGQNFFCCLNMNFYSREKLSGFNFG